jgi:hypothetical protein
MMPASVRARARRRADGEGGAVIVELALIFPFLAMLLFGTLTGGLVLNRRLAISQASREGARYGATVAMDQCAVVSSCGGRTWAEQVRHVTLSRAGGSATEANICVALVEGPGSAPVPLSAAHTTKSTLTPCYVDNSADSGRRVQVVITFTDKIEAVITQVPVSATARSTSKLEQ